MKRQVLSDFVREEKRDCFGYETATSQWLPPLVVARAEGPKQSGGIFCRCERSEAISGTTLEAIPRPCSDTFPLSLRGFLFCHCEERSDEAASHPGKKRFDPATWWRTGRVTV